MKFEINSQVVENDKSTTISIPKKKIISNYDWIYNKNNFSSTKSYCPNFYTDDYVWNYYEIKIDFSKFPDKTAYLVFYSYPSGTSNHSIIPYLYTQKYGISRAANIGSLSSYDFDSIYDFVNSTFMKYKRCSLFMLRSDEDKFYYRLDSPLTSHKSSFEGYFSKLNDQKDILNLGIASKGNNDQSSYDDIINNNLSIKQSQFVFINTEDKNLNNSFRLADLISETKCMAGSCFGLSYSHKYVWKFGIINYSDSDIDLNIASYKKDLTDTLDNLIKETNGKADGDASIEPKIDYEIKQILPLIKDSNFNEDF